MSDIKSTDLNVEVEGEALVSKTWDFRLDSSDRRISPTPEFRRALVHDIGDKLSINYGGDYPGGVYISGQTVTEEQQVTGNAKVEKDLQVTGILQALGSSHPNIDTHYIDTTSLRTFQIIADTPWMGGPKTLVIKTGDVFLVDKDVSQDPSNKANIALSHVTGDKLVINRGGGFAGGVQIDGNLHVPGKLMVDMLVKLPEIGGGSHEVLMPTDIGFAIKNLQKEILDLQARVKSLEQRR